MSALLGGLSPQHFLDRHWQKRPLVVRQAIPGFRGFVDSDALLRLAARRDVVSRVVTLDRGKRHLTSGPFRKAPSAQTWTLLVQGIESVHQQGWPLLRRFDAVVPRARLDDLMISYATVGAGVGPHIDRYDVFLLQGEGKRRWRLQSTGRIEIDDRADVPTVKHFVPDEEHVLEAGDLLYLPPGVVHDGTAVDGPCFTYSIGAIAPSVEGLQQNFLAFMSQHVEQTTSLHDMYEDPDLRAPAHAAVLDVAMVKRTQALLRTVEANDDMTTIFLGRLLTGAKPGVTFHKQRSKDVNAGVTVMLAMPARALVAGSRVFIAGDVYDVDDADSDWWCRLCGERSAVVPRLGARSRHALMRAFERGVVRC